jgi:hypothetical protein
MGQGSSSSSAGTPQRPSPAMVRSEGAVTTAAVATAATADGAVVSETAHAEAVQEDGEGDGEDSFNYNSEAARTTSFPLL